jgi:hypothetical protein
MDTLYIWEFISTTESCEMLATETFQQLMTLDESSSDSGGELNGEDEPGAPLPLNPSYPPIPAISSF